MDYGGWDSGQITTTQTYLPTAEVDSNNAIEQNFLDFLRNFRLGSVFPYRDQLRKNIIIKSYFLEVDLSDLITFDQDLANSLKLDPKNLLPLFESAVKTLAIQSTLVSNDDSKFQVMLISRSNPIAIRDLDTPYISKLVRVSGIIISANSMQAKATRIHLACRSCRHIKVLDVPSGIHGVTIPRTCEGEPDPTGAKPKCPLDPYVVVHHKSVFIDQQMLKLQEPHGMVPVGELPRHLLLSADRYLTGKVTPGMRVTVTGVFDIFNQASMNSKKGSGGAVAIRSPYIQVYGLQIDPDANGAAIRSFTPEEEEEFLAISRRPNLYSEFIGSIAPQIYGSDDIKKSIACLLFGGSKKILPDGMRLRGDVNVLLLGDPGTAKSQLLKFVEQVAPIAVYTSGKGSSAAGLTASVNRDPATREFRLEAGAMVLADGGVVCIDEFDKMRDEDRVAIHEAMEQQTISIAKAGITTILNSRTSVLAAANPVFGRYDDMKSPGDNIEFQSTILSRFDLIFIVRDEHNEERDQTIAKHVIGVHMNRDTQEVIEGDLDIQKMRSYISYCKTKCAPRLSPEASEKLTSHFVEMRAKIRVLDGELKTNAKTAIPITVRQLEAIIRISESLAKMSLSPVATERHVDEAIRLFNFSTMNAIQSGMVEGVTRGKFAEEVGQVEEVIRRRFAVGSSMSERRLKDELLKQDFSENSVNRAVYQLITKEVLVYQDRRSKIARVRP
ncbi:MCM2/3/5 family-domain-containing protein [Globomyces pollinis-pini]|nr:MCM2/3/5 family-domain-containing protein [Globomyces pollinis-pini]